MKKNNKKDKGTFVRLSQEEIDMLSILKKKHFMNISAMVRQSIRSIYEQLEQGQKI
jgi:hypothetical protein